jgi:polar amino acid transport system permease protein
VVSTLAVLGVAVVAVTQSPGWPRVQKTYFDPSTARDVFPDVAKAFWLNIRIFLVAEVFILIVAVVVAIIRVVPVPALAPIKLLATIYTDVFRGTPTILVVFLVGFGVPALNLAGMPTSLFWLGVIALTLSYGAYVAEVLRAGILSIHPTQWASGRALGLSYGQTMRHVVLPQAVRRVAPPLLNDFVSLQKDTALLSIIGLVEALRVAQINSGDTFNFTGYVVAAVFFIAATIPLARFTDYLTVRSLRRENGLVV